MSQLTVAVSTTDRPPPRRGLRARRRPARPRALDRPLPHRLGATRAPRRRAREDEGRRPLRDPRRLQHARPHRRGGLATASAAPAGPTSCARSGWRDATEITFTNEILQRGSKLEALADPLVKLILRALERQGARPAQGDLGRLRPMAFGVQRQTAVYVDGVSGRKPRVPVDHDELERAAERAMSPEAFAYIAGGAGGEATVRANRAGLGRVADRPADAARRLRARHVRRAVRPALPGPVPARPGRRAGDGPPAGGPRRRPRRARRGRPDGDLQPGVDADGGHRRGRCRTPRAGSSCTGRPPTTSSSHSSAAPRRRARTRSRSRSTPRCWAGARATSTSPTCPSCAARASPSTRATPSSPSCSTRRSTPTRRTRGRR